MKPGRLPIRQPGTAMSPSASAAASRTPDYLSTISLRRQMDRLGRAQLTDRLHAVRALSAVRGLRFIDDRHQPRTIELAAVPWILTPAQLHRFRTLVHELVAALMRLPMLYAKHPEVRQILSLDPAQESWLRLASHPRSQPWAVIGRMDSTATFDRHDWQRTFLMLEPNAVGAGGVHYAPTACTVIADVFGDVLERAYPGLQLVPTPDPRQLLIEELARLSHRLGRPLRRLGLVENADYTTGTDEFAHLARYLTRQGLQSIIVDPREVSLSNGRLMARRLELDFLYRDCELNEFVALETPRRPLKGVRAAIRQGRLISGLLWEFDHKSSWEILTSPQLARYFTVRQRRFFHAHLPWTRMVRPAQVPDPDGRLVDLPAFIRSHQAELVLKPNTLYGGQGVIVGQSVSRQVWERTLTQALRGDEPYVVQQLARIATHQFPALTGSGFKTVDRRVVSGFFFNSSDVGLVGRFSDDPVVNVSRGGGLVSAFMVSH